MSTIMIEQELKAIKEFITRQALQQKDILTLREAALYAGISTSYLYKLTSARRIPFYKPALKLIFFRKAELDNWLLKNRQPTISELSEVPTNKSRRK